MAMRVAHDGAACTLVAGEATCLSAAVASEALSSCASMLAQRFDASRGGFGSAPKFPRPCEVNALLARHAHASSRGDTAAAGMSLTIFLHFHRDWSPQDMPTCVSLFI